MMSKAPSVVDLDIRNGNAFRSQFGRKMADPTTPAKEKASRMLGGQSAVLLLFLQAML
jgi:hypothetical protein